VRTAAERQRPGRRALGRGALSLALVACLVACDARRVDLTPESVVRELLERLKSLHGDKASAAAVFELLSASTRENLQTRSQRYGAASGKNIAPAAMLAPASYLERWHFRELRTKIVGAHALVEVLGFTPDQRAEIPCVYEDGGWRVVIALPPLPEVRVSPREDGPEEVRR
jgi:hypothetical protein